MKVIKEISAMQDISDYYKCMSKKIALVPTMGYLHDGHISLINKAREENDIIVVSIFVNPTQFGKNEDFNEYPRDFNRDKLLCGKAGTDYIFNPEVDEMYKKNCYTSIIVSQIADKLEGKLRSGHFTGVATIVAKLLNAVKPHNLYLGQKDAQQNIVIKKMIEDLNIDTHVIICQTVREKNGLAMSSRNTYLSKEEKKEASSLYFILNEGKRMIIQNNVIDSNEIKKYINELFKEKASKMELQYYEITDNRELEPIVNLKEYQGEVLISLAAKIGSTRLIDNILFSKK